MVEVKDVGVLFVVLLFVGGQLVDHPHLPVVEFDDWRRFIESHVVLGVGGVVEFLHSRVMQKVVLLF